MSILPTEPQPPPDGGVATPADRREHQRFTGPFDGLRVDALETPIRIYDLSRGGCFITAMHAQRPGVRMTLRIELPPDGWITVTAETLARSDELGFAVRFIHIEADEAARFERALTRLGSREPHRP